MKSFVGIDLGTTNSAISSFDGTNTRIWKSPEQNDVTPSAIYIDRRGNKYIGKRAYDTSPQSPDNAALLFKRVMGTSTPINLPALNLTMTPEECSAEILKVLFGYLPEEMRNDLDIGTVITVPAAFNQMQKDATMEAARLAGIGKVALMQEPVAAIMSVMRTKKADGVFLVYDLGGGTLDIAIADSLGGRVNLLAHGGIAMCGGRDFDRGIFDNIVKPWLINQFALPDDFVVNPSYKSLIRLSTWAAEKAKIELSAKAETMISLTETEVRLWDLAGNEIYLEIPINRAELDEIMEERINDSINAARETIARVGLTPHDFERLVFVGGPTNYKPLRDKVSFELGIPGNINVNPMTAVAEGAAVFAESIDWNSQNRSRKSTRGQISSGGSLQLTFNYIARTPENKAKIAAQVIGNISPKSEFQIDNTDNGWTSGRLPLKHGVIVEVNLSNAGENNFKVSVFDEFGGAITLANNKIVITKTAAAIDAIPASHSVGVEVLDKLGGRASIDWLIRIGESLPKKGKKVYKSGEALKSGSPGSLNFKLWEGEIDDPVTDNRPVGVFSIYGTDFDEGVIHAGADLICEYEIIDSGNIVIEISVPQIGGAFHSGRNFYSRREGQFDFSADSDLVKGEGEKTLNRLEEISDQIDNPKLEYARDKLKTALNLDQEETDVEKTQEAMEKVLEARNIIAQVRKENLKQIREIELNNTVNFFNECVRQYARPTEGKAFDSMVETAQNSINRSESDFEGYLKDLRSKNFDVLWRQDWFVIDRFKYLISSPHQFIDKRLFAELSQSGIEHIKKDNIDELREIVYRLSLIQLNSGFEDGLLDPTNIVRG